MNFKKNGGFTLVELIVVIAILGLLAGIGIPAYGNYVEKASIAVDNQNLNMLHNVFVVSCVEHSVDPGTVSITSISYENNVFKGITGISGASAAYYGRRSGGTGEDKNTLIMNSFNGYIGSEGIQFKSKDMTAEKIMEGIKFGVKTEGGTEVKVVENEDGTFTYTAGNLSVTLQPEDAAILAGDNAFSDRGSAALLNDVAVLENLLSTGIGSDVLESVVATEDFVNALGGYLGLTPNAGESNEDYATRVEAALEENENPQSALYSAQIMYAASKAANATEEQISDLFTGTVTSNIEVKNGDGSTNYEATMANAALAYGMYTAYAQKNNIDTTTNEGNFTNVINSTEFANYYSTQGKTDLEAYQAAMNIISDNTDNSDVTGSILANGISGNADLEALMKEIMGS